MAYVLKTKDQEQTLDFISKSMKELKKLEQFLGSTMPDSVLVEAVDETDTSKKVKRELFLGSDFIRKKFMDQGTSVAKEIRVRAKASNIALAEDEEEIVNYFTVSKKTKIRQETEGNKEPSADGETTRKEYSTAV